MIKIFQESFSAIIFDMDGTLLDSETLGFRAWSIVMKEYGKTLEREFFGSMVGRTAADVEQLFYQQYSPSFPFAEARARRIEVGDKIIAKEGISCMKFALDVLELLKSKPIKIGLATSTYRDRAEVRMKQAGIDGYFDAEVYGNEIEQGKPQPDIFLKAAELLLEEPENCLVVEDAGPGVLAASAADMKCLLIPDFLKPSGNVLEKSWKVLESLEDLLRNVEEGED